MSELVIIKPVGKPLPFSFDILSSVFQYGNLCFTKYPADMPDYFKQAFPDGMSYERSFLFEDGGVATASWNIRYICNFSQLWHSENIGRRNEILKNIFDAEQGVAILKATLSCDSFPKTHLNDIQVGKNHIKSIVT